jgi:hypothetical protein
MRAMTSASCASAGAVSDRCSRSICGAGVLRFGSPARTSFYAAALGPASFWRCRYQQRGRMDDIDKEDDGSIPLSTVGTALAKAANSGPVRPFLHQRLRCSASTGAGARKRSRKVGRSSARKTSMPIRVGVIRCQGPRSRKLELTRKSVSLRGEELSRVGFIVVAHWFGFSGPRPGFHQGHRLRPGRARLFVNSRI